MLKKKVLVLEDEDNIRAFVVINLGRAGYETVEFALGEQAAEYLRTHDDVSIAVLDVMHGGRLDIESTVGQGTDVIITLPLDTQTAEHKTTGDTELL